MAKAIARPSSRAKELEEFNKKLRLQREVIQQNATAMIDAKEQAKTTIKVYAESQQKLGDIVDEFNKTLPLFDGDGKDEK